MLPCSLLRLRPSDPCSAPGLCLYTLCILLQGHSQTVLGCERAQASWGRIHISLHHSTSKQLPKSAVTRLACCAVYLLAPLSAGQ